ncbi:MAG: hypothetical protein JNL35_12635 [Sphingopyxis sp.]|nr:hypothetical protein [Sphingopyxis sp.]
MSTERIMPRQNTEIRGESKANGGYSGLATSLVIPAKTGIRLRLLSESFVP